MKVLRHKHASEDTLTAEKMIAFENHINVLQGENVKLVEAVRGKRDALSQQVLK